MEQRSNILQELNELQSSLANTQVQNTYEVPAGYFDGLAELMLRRVKAMDAENAAEELGYLSPFLSNIPKTIPYSVPTGYFESLSVPQGEFFAESNQTATEELERLSPLLSGLKKEMPYSVPQGYFEKLNNGPVVEEAKPAKVVSMTKQSWFRYAAAAVVIGFVAMIGFSLLSKKEIDPITKPSEWVKSSTKKISTDEINNFVESAGEKAVDERTQALAIVESKNEMNEIKELIKDVSDKDIDSFLDDAQVDDSGSDDALMN